jgi:hypothetical protein
MAFLPMLLRQMGPIRTDDLWAAERLNTPPPPVLMHPGKISDDQEKIA